MPELLVRGIDPEVLDRMRKAAEAQGKSLAQTAREALSEKFNPADICCLSAFQDAITSPDHVLAP